MSEKTDLTDSNKENTPLVLKKNEYKCVELNCASDGTKYITKCYSGHPAENLIDNTRYIYKSLQFFHEQFSDILQTPKPYNMELEEYKVGMQYLPDLQHATTLTLNNISSATSFFHKCYAITMDHGFIRSIHGSVVATPGVEALLENNFPLCLGFKGDLKENLCQYENNLILADIDSICLEPLGLSELLLYIELYASFKFLPTLSSMIGGIQSPVAFGYLDRNRAQLLIDATLELLELKIKHRSRAVQKTKKSIAQSLLDISIKHHYLA